MSAYRATRKRTYIENHERFLRDAPTDQLYAYARQTGMEVDARRAGRGTNVLRRKRYLCAQLSLGEQFARLTALAKEPTRRAAINLESLRALLEPHRIPIPREMLTFFASPAGSTQPARKERWADMFSRWLAETKQTHGARAPFVLYSDERPFVSDLQHFVNVVYSGRKVHREQAIAAFNRKYHLSSNALNGLESSDRDLRKRTLQALANAYQTSNRPPARAGDRHYALVPPADVPESDSAFAANTDAIPDTRDSVCVPKWLRGDLRNYADIVGNYQYAESFIPMVCERTWSVLHKVDISEHVERYNGGHVLYSVVDTPVMGWPRARFHVFDAGIRSVDIPSDHAIIGIVDTARNRGWVVDPNGYIAGSVEGVTANILAKWMTHVTGVAVAKLSDYTPHYSAQYWQDLFEHWPSSAANIVQNMTEDGVLGETGSDLANYTPENGFCLILTSLFVVLALSNYNLTLPAVVAHFSKHVRQTPAKVSVELREFVAKIVKLGRNPNATARTRFPSEYISKQINENSTVPEPRCALAFFDRELALRRVDNTSYEDNEEFMSNSKGLGSLFHSPRTGSTVLLR